MPGADTVIPDELRSLERWVVWKTEERDGKLTKVLYNPHAPATRAKSNDPATWSTYDKAEAARSLSPKYGIGFVFNGDGIIGVDFDHVRNADTGEIDPAAMEEITLLNSYTEVSPSGTGVHVICKGKIPGNRNRKGNREMYATGRYFTVTGRRVPGTPDTINDAQSGIDQLTAKWFNEPESSPEPTRSSPDTTPKPDTLTDDQVIALAKRAKNREKFIRLMDGDISGYPTPSEADAALCAILAFHTRDPVQIDRIFRQSGLYREKWNRDDYRTDTINKALILVKPQRRLFPTVTPPAGSIAELVKLSIPILNKKGEVVREKVEIDRQKFVLYIVDKYHTISVGGNVWLYKNGYYHIESGEINAELSAIVRDLDLQNQTTNRNEIMTMLAGTNFYRDSPFNYKIGVIPCKNGVVHIDFGTGEITGPFPHTPDNLFTYCLPTDYDPAAPIEPVLAVLKQWVSEADVPILHQFPAQGFVQSMIDATYKKSYLFQGETNSGKSSYFELLYRTLGRDDSTMAHVSIHTMTDRPFALIDLENRILNIYDDLDGSELEQLGRFKNITGGTHHTIERKHAKSYNGRIFCAHAFACNIPPKVPEKAKYDTAFWDRWEYTVFCNSFTKDPLFYDKTFTPAFMSGFLNLILQSMVTIYRDNNLIVNSTPDQVMEKWFQDSDPLCQFVDEMTTITNRDQDYDKDLLFKAYKEWFDDQKYDERRKIITMEKFSRDIQQYGFIPSQCTVKRDSSEKKKRSARVPCYKSNRVWNDGQLQVAPQPPEQKVTSA